MRSLRNFAVNLLLVFASIAVTLLLLEAGLRLFPVAWSPPVQPPTAQNPIQRYAANAPATWSLGWDFTNVVHGRTNAQGWLADYDYDPDAKTPLVAVVGDSYMEALRVPFAETVTGRLHAALGARGRAYVFAQSGSPLSQYVAYAARACATYHPQKLVVSIVGNDFDESLYAHRRRDGIYHLYPRADGRFDWKLTPLPPAGLLERIARHSALALYIARNVGVTNIVNLFGPRAAQAQAPRYVGNTEADADASRIAEGEAVIRWFIDALPRAACLSPQDIVIMVDGIRPELYRPETLAAAEDSYFGRMRRAMLAQAAAAGFMVVDMQPRFQAAFAADGQRFEFPTDSHWSSHGHAVAATAVREALAGWAPLAP